MAIKDYFKVPHLSMRARRQILAVGMAVAWAMNSYALFAIREQMESMGATDGTFGLPQKNTWQAMAYHARIDTRASMARNKQATCTFLNIGDLELCGIYTVPNGERNPGHLRRAAFRASQELTRAKSHYIDHDLYMPARWVAAYRGYYSAGYNEAAATRYVQKRFFKSIPGKSI